MKAFFSKDKNMVKEFITFLPGTFILEIGNLIKCKVMGKFIRNKNNKFMKASGNKIIRMGQEYNVGKKILGN